MHGGEKIYPPSDLPKRQLSVTLVFIGLDGRQEQDWTEGTAAFAPPTVLNTPNHRYLCVFKVLPAVSALIPTGRAIAGISWNGG